MLAACCLLLACLLAKPVRCTLDTKEGHKTKTSSTGSVTLTLTLTKALTLREGHRYFWGSKMESNDVA